jgi:predicted metal-dependent hydrolase
MFGLRPKPKPKPAADPAATAPGAATGAGKSGGARLPVVLPSGRQVEALVRARRGTRRLALKIDPVARTLVLAVPPRTARRTLDDMVAQHSAWIEEKLAALPAAMPFDEGATILLRGEPVRLARRPGRGVPQLAAAAGDAPAILTVAADSPARFGPRVLAALKTLAHADTVASAHGLMARLERAPGTVTIRDAKSRWGSCSSRGDIMLNWRLIGAPPAVLEYVVAHELAHLKELNHSARFWAEVRRLMPGYAPARDWLRQHGTTLHALGASH